MAEVQQENGNTPEKILNRVGAGFGQKHPLWRPLMTSDLLYVKTLTIYLCVFSSSSTACLDIEESQLSSSYKFILDQCFGWVHLTHHGLLLTRPLLSAIPRLLLLVKAITAGLRTTTLARPSQKLSRK